MPTRKTYRGPRYPTDNDSLARRGAMTEAEWSVCTEPTPMLDFLGDEVSERELRLLACAIVRHVPITREGKTVWEFLPEYDWFASPRGSCHTVIETAER